MNPVHVLELLDPPPSTLVLADWSTRLGQDLFGPPNVGGWPGGRSWLSAALIDQPGALRLGARGGRRGSAASGHLSPPPWRRGMAEAPAAVRP